MKNFIVDGMDRCGKSTLIEKLSLLMSKDYSIISTHYPKIIFDKDQDPIKYNKKLYSDTFNLLHYANLNLMQCIMDRSHISEFVYGQMYRNYNTEYVFKSEFNGDFHSFALNTALIILVDDPEGIIERDDNKSNSISKRNLLKEQSLFLAAFHQTKIKKKIFINIKDKTEEDVFDLVSRHQLAQFNKNGDIF